jgi:hypothetical protein
MKLANLIKTVAVGMCQVLPIYVYVCCHFLSKHWQMQCVESAHDPSHVPTANVLIESGSNSSSKMLALSVRISVPGDPQ